MDRDLRRSAYISGFAHIAVIIAAIITLPLPPLPTAPESGVDVTIIGLAPQKSPVKGPGVPAHLGPVHHTDIQAENTPKRVPTNSVPPPPPPPPPSNAPPKPTPPVPNKLPPPPPAVPNTASTLPPPPKVQPQQKPNPAPPKEKVQPEKKPPSSVKSATHQQHEVKTPQPLSQSVLNTIENLEAEQPKQPPPTAQYNPDQDTDTNPGGSPNSTANSGLSGPDRAAIGNHVRPCWDVDPEAPGLQGFSVLLTVTTDSTGTVRVVNVSPNNTGDMSNPYYNAYTQRAEAALLNPICATLPLPNNMLGQNQTFTFQFTP